MARTDDLIGRHYGRALLAVALEMRGEEFLPKLEGELTRLTELTSGEAGRFFASPVFGFEEKTGLLAEFLRARGADRIVGRFLGLLIEEGHLRFLPTIAAEYAEALREHRNEVRARVRTAFEMGNAERTRVQSALGRALGKTVLMDVEVDPGLIGGVVAEVGGTVYDASISGFLKRLREEFAR